MPHHREWNCSLSQLSEHNIKFFLIIKHINKPTSSFFKIPSPFENSQHTCRKHCLNFLRLSETYSSREAVPLKDATWRFRGWPWAGTCWALGRAAHCSNSGLLLKERNNWQCKSINILKVHCIDSETPFQIFFKSLLEFSFEFAASTRYNITGNHQKDFPP